MSGEGGDHDQDGPAISMRVLTFDGEMNVVDAPDDYATNFDEEFAADVAESLCGYLDGFAQENDQQVSFVQKKHEIEGTRADGSSLLISCYGRDLFDLQRWASPSEPSPDGRLAVADLTKQLNADVMVTLARRFIINGHLDD